MCVSFNICKKSLKRPYIYKVNVTERLSDYRASVCSLYASLSKADEKLGVPVLRVLDVLQGLDYKEKV